MINGKKPKGMDNWETPMWLYDQLNEQFNFTVDAASDIQNCKCYLKLSNGNYNTSYFANALENSWAGHRFFCNPPFSIKFDFIARAKEQIKTGGCHSGAMILPCTMEVIRELHGVYWHELPYRVAFIDPATGQPVKNNTTGTIIARFYSDIVRPLTNKYPKGYIKK